MNLPRRSSQLFVLILLILLFNCSKNQSSTEQQSQSANSQSATLKKIRVSLPPYPSAAPIIIAQRQGYFKEQGLEVEFIKSDRSGEAVPSLDKGDLDVIAGTASIAMFNAIARGAKIRLVADRGYLSTVTCNSNALMIRHGILPADQKPGTVDAANLRNRKIGLQRGTISEYYLEKLLKTVNLTPNDVEYVYAPLPANFEAIQSGKLDLSITTEPWINRLTRTGAATVYAATADLLPDFSLSVLLFGPNLLEKEPEVGKRFMIAYLKGARQANQGPTPANVEMVITELGLNKEDSICWQPVHEDGKINLATMLDFENWAVAKKLLDQAPTAAQFWDGSFVEYANKTLNTTH